MRLLYFRLINYLLYYLKINLDCMAANVRADGAAWEFFILLFLYLLIIIINYPTRLNRIRRLIRSHLDDEHLLVGDLWRLH